MRSLRALVVIAACLSGALWIDVAQRSSGARVVTDLAATEISDILAGGETWSNPQGGASLVFEPNRGPAAAGTAFLSRGRGYTLHLRPGEAVWALIPVSVNSAPVSADISPVPADIPPGPTSVAPTPAHISPVIAADRYVPRASGVLSMRLAGGNSDAPIVGVEPLVGHSNYILGNDPGGWISGVPHFAAVRYQDAYPGIDLVFYGMGGQLEYDFIVGAQSDPAVIRFDVDGPEAISIDEAGNLVLQVGAREMVQSAPRAYQVVGGVAQAQRARAGQGRVTDGMETSEIEVRFVLYDGEELAPEEARASVGFEVGAYDVGLPLVIDPAVGFSTFLGGSGAEEMPHVAVDRQANVYVAGTTSSIDFPLVRAASRAGVDAEAGVAGGADRSAEAAGAAGPDEEGMEGPAAGPNAFVTKLSADGSTILYSTYFGGSGADRANGIVVDDEGNAYLTGQTDSADDFGAGRGARLCLPALRQ